MAWDVATGGRLQGGGGKVIAYPGLSFGETGDLWGLRRPIGKGRRGSSSGGRRYT